MPAPPGHSERLGDELRMLTPLSNPRQVWTSARRRCISTARPMAELGYKVVHRQQMYELNPGDVDGLTLDQIREKYPEEWARAEKDPYAHRYPRAESYHDLSVRCVSPHALGV